jgi:hypothetical protein
MELSPVETTGTPISDLLDATIAAFDQGKAAPPQAGVSLIDQWFGQLDTLPEAGPLLESLTELRAELENGTPTNQALVSTLTDLADRTQTVADGSDEVAVQSRLTTLAQAFRNFTTQLSTAI